MVTKFGEDKTKPNNEIYWGSKVNVGTKLAFIDDSIYKAQLDLANANLESSRAKVQAAQATLKQTTADYLRAQETFKKKAIAQADLDAAEAAYETAKANVNVANATVDQDTATLKQAQTNENYTVIASPVKGTIIDRRVNIGQTVVASLSASEFVSHRARPEAVADLGQRERGRHRPYPRRTRCDVHGRRLRRPRV